MPVAGKNDGIEPLLISAAQFRSYVERHAHLAAEDLDVVAEDNAAMTGSYIMIDPMGRFFDNVDGRLAYSPPILEVGVEQAFASLTLRVAITRLCSRVVAAIRRS